MAEQFARTVTINGVEYPLVMEYSRYHNGNAPYIGWFTSYSFAGFLNYIHQFSKFPYILCGVSIITYHTSSPATLLNKVYDYRVRFYKVKVDDNQLNLFK